MGEFLNIFLFHRVSPVRNKSWDPIDPMIFKRTLKNIKKRYTVVQLESFLLGERADYKKGREFAAIVFDDGFKDNLEYALPILKECSCEASLYIVTDCITTGLPTWNFEIDHLITSTQKDELYFHNELQDGSVKLRNQADKRDFSFRLKHKLKFIDNAERLHILNEVRQQIDDVDLPYGLMLNWDEVRTLYEENIYIGSHTASHPRLGYIKSDDDIRKELVTSSNEINIQLGYYPVTLSYPMGSYNETVKKIALESGYLFGLAINESKHNLTSGDNYEMMRIQMFSESWLKTWLRITGFMTSIKKFTANAPNN